MMRYLLLAAALFAATGGAAADRATFDPRTLPRVAARAEHFVPAGYVIEHTATGDLSADGRPDLALTLVESAPAGADPDDPPARARMLLVLIRNDDGYGRAAASTRLLQCTRCGGAFYGVAESPVEVSIARGVLIAAQDGGSRNVVRSTYRFRREPRSGAFALIGFDRSDSDRATGERVEESTNYLTGVKLTERFQYDPATDRESRRGLSRTRVTTRPPSLDTLDAETFAG